MPMCGSTSGFPYTVGAPIFFARPARVDFPERSRAGLASVRAREHNGGRKPKQT
jgi:hypothetical protein